MNGMRRMRDKPPLCKGRWIAKQDGGIVRKGVAAWGMMGGRENHSPTGVCIARWKGGGEGDGKGVRLPTPMKVDTV